MFLDESLELVNLRDILSFLILRTSQGSDVEFVRMVQGGASRRDPGGRRLGRITQLLNLLEDLAVRDQGQPR